MTEPRRLSDRELEDIIGYEADFTGATYKPTTTFLMAREIIALREGAKQGIAAANATSELAQRILAERDELRDQLRLANIDASKLREGLRSDLGTCDWGDCMRLAVTTRFDNEDAMRALPVCVIHSEEYALAKQGNRVLSDMISLAAKVLTDLADMDDDGSPRLMVIAGEAKRTLKAMREIGGYDA